MVSYISLRINYPNEDYYITIRVDDIPLNVYYIDLFILIRVYYITMRGNENSIRIY